MSMAEDVRTDSRADRSFDAYFRGEHQRLVALATVLCGDRELARDLAQEALVRTYTHWDEVARLERPGAWTRKVLLNLIRDHGRHGAVLRRRLPELAREADRVRVVVDAPFDSEFWAAVATLSDRQRTAVALFYVGDRSVRHVAEVMEIREGSVKTTLHQARKRLHHLLSEVHE
jgi:RNA polymerase sigma-70 factor, ECF subfamily